MCEVNWEVVTNLIGIAANIALTVWIVVTIQTRLNNDRVLKDHFIGEVKGVRDVFNVFVTEVRESGFRPKQFQSRFKSYSVILTSLTADLDRAFGADKAEIFQQLIALNQLVTEDENFIAAHNRNKETKLSIDGERRLLEFQGKFQSVFNRVIIFVNGCKVKKVK